MLVVYTITCRGAPLLWVVGGAALFTCASQNSLKFIKYSNSVEFKPMYFKPRESEVTCATDSNFLGQSETKYEAHLPTSHHRTR